MTHENVVAVGIDGSDRSLLGLNWGIELAKKRQSRVHLVCAYELPTFAAHVTERGMKGEESRLYDAVQDAIQVAVDKVEEAGVEVSYSMESGDPTGVLVELSRQVATVVIGSRGKGSFADRFFGTVSAAVPAHAYCPTVVVPETMTGDCLPVKHIVVGVDGSDTSKMALQRAVWEAERWNAKLTVVSAVNLNSVAWLPGAGYSSDVLDDIRSGLDVAVAQAVGDRDIDVRTHAIEGNPAALLAEFSTAVDLLVIGTRGRGGFAGLVMGSTSQAILNHAVCPVMVVPKRVRPGDDVPPSVTEVPWNRPQ